MLTSRWWKQWLYKDAQTAPIVPIVAYPCSISAIIVVQNSIQELHTIAHTLYNVLEQTCTDFEIIIANNNSTDGTRLLAEAMEVVCPHHIVVVHRTSTYMDLLRDSFAVAQHELTYFTHVDSKFDEQYLSQLLPYICEYDCIFSTRHPTKSSNLSRGISWLYRKLLYMVFGTGIHSVTSFLCKSDMTQSLICPTYTTDDTAYIALIYALIRCRRSYIQVSFERTYKCVYEEILELRKLITYVGQCIRNAVQHCI